MRPAPEDAGNRVRAIGRLTGIRHRWTPDGSQAVIAELVTDRPPLGPVRASSPETQPLPLRAQGGICEALMRLEGERVLVEGTLRRRYYRREGEPRWGQVEIWVDLCRPVGEAADGMQGERDD